MGHPPRIPVWLRWEQSVIYFVTICVKDRKRVLVSEAAFNAFKNAAGKLQEWRVLAGLLMPDHLHAVVAPRERDAQLGNFSAALKRWMRKELNASWEWQPGCFDRLLRSDGVASREVALHPGKPGPRWPRQGLERLAIPI